MSVLDKSQELQSLGRMLARTVSRSFLRTAALAPRAVAVRGLAGKIEDGENAPPEKTDRACRH